MVTIQTISDKDLMKIERFTAAHTVCERCRAACATQGGASKNIEQVNKECIVCGRLRDATLTDNIIRAIASEGYEWDSFRISVVIPRLGSSYSQDELEAYDLLRQFTKSDIKRDTGQKLETKLNKPVNTDMPDLDIILSSSGEIKLEGAPIYIQGKYHKHMQWVSQSVWFCNDCGGRGCIECGFRGRHYASSIDEIILTPLTSVFRGQSALLHAGGREDVDVLVKGNGRPFVAQVVNPHRRKVELSQVREIINEYARGIADVTDLQITGKSSVRELKVASESGEKTYTGVIRVQSEVTRSRVEDVAKQMRGIVLQQATPFRVLSRRANLRRMKHIISVDLNLLEPRTLGFVVKCQGGTYIKEFISGDDGRTNPSIAGALHTPAVCIELCLMDVCHK